MNPIIRIATRESQLALWQAKFIRDQLQQYYPFAEIHLLPMRTTGDAFLKDKLKVIGGKGHFVKELEEALLRGDADIAVHSMKDVPASFPDGLCLPIICQRDNPNDAFVSNNYAHLDTLPQGAVVGTSSARRQAQLLTYRPDLCIRTLRGNVQTRLKKLDDGEYDAIILACAGLERLALASRIRSELSAEQMLPACGQGALGIECRSNDKNIQTLLQALHDPASQQLVSAERRVNQQLGGHCHAPIAVFAQYIDTQRACIRARVFSEDGKQMLESHQQGPILRLEEMAMRCANELEEQGALALIEAAR